MGTTGTKKSRTSFTW